MLKTQSFCRYTVVRAFSTMLVLFAGLVLCQPVQAQYYPPTGYAQPGYDPAAVPPTGPAYGYPQQQPGYAPYGQVPPPAAPPDAAYPPPPAFGYPPADPAQAYPGYAPPPGGDVASFGMTTPYYGAPPPGAPMAPGMDGTGWAPPAQNVPGFKFSYHSQSGDYFNMQSPNAARWEQFPVTLHLSYPEQASDAAKKAIKSAVTAWQKHVDIKLVDRPEQARIEVTWVSKIEDDTDLGETEFTHTHVDGLGRTIIDKATIRMLDPANYNEVVSGALKSAMMHQLGHALGIHSHSDNDRDLMAEPYYKTVKSQVVRKAVKSLASKTIGQFLDIGKYGDDDDDAVKPRSGAPIIRISRRDLNTLFRIYN